MGDRGRRQAQDDAGHRADHRGEDAEDEGLAEHGATELGSGGAVRGGQRERVPLA
ncbi:MAG: hypothetical protein JF622_12255 [Terrabacter sp.]|nr:hypothetical protein [Terrabacter sp.]